MWHKIMITYYHDLYGLYLCVNITDWVYIASHIYMWPDLPKRVLYMHSLKTHFSSPSISYFNEPTAHVFNTAEGWTVFLSGFFKPVTSMSAWWPLNGPISSWQADSRLWITTWLADEFGHGFSCFVWHVEVKMAPMVVISLFLVKT